ncbi:Lead, cadmium, zinc and mercury transporting ATPase [Labilithrix luteola]|uniref:Lead, cadmium, zinc and mercury transporting ATPase n=1 Tax=Labilithrix luteola TaxID=1391654 RepID=A0A0K1QDM0_9BACT|nr:cation transporter [Labilithrix luteola]AKV03859.1 Lead, cadmium, zinc and mercury transporting ATPase [Labilithrix luteola]
MSTNKATVLDVQGMSCASCVRHVNAALRELDGVESVDVELAVGRTSKVRVQHDPSKVAVTALIGAVEEAGYSAKEVA